MEDIQEKIEALLEIETVLLALNLEDGTIEFDSYYRQETQEGSSDVIVLHSTYEDELEDHILGFSEFLADKTICEALLSHVVLQPVALQELCDRYMKYYPKLTVYTKEDKNAYDNIQTLQTLLSIYTSPIEQLRINIDNQYDIEDGFNFTYTIWNIIKSAEDEEDIFYKCIAESRKSRKKLRLIL